MVAAHSFIGGRDVVTIAAALYMTDITSPAQRTARLNILGSHINTVSEQSSARQTRVVRVAPLSVL